VFQEWAECCLGEMMPRMSGEMMPRRTVSGALIKICWNECGTRRVAGVSPLSGLRLLWPHRRDCAHDHFCSLAHGTVGALPS
jgi:hypothetical protein